MIRRLAQGRYEPQTDFGATAVEYALMVAFIALVIIAAVVILGTNLSAIFVDAASKV